MDSPLLYQDSKVYRNLAMELIFLCRFFVQAHQKADRRSLKSAVRLRNVLVTADDALRSAAESGCGKKRSERLDGKFATVINLLVGFEKDFLPKTSYPNISGMIRRKANMSQSPWTILHALKWDLHSKPMGNSRPKPNKVFTFYLLSTLPDAHPIIVEQRLSDLPSIQEILWNFSRSKDEKRRLTLMENPHFYAKLPTSPEAYGDSIRINPTEDFGHPGTFYVLMNKPELVYIMTNQVLWSLGNFWCPDGAIIFKGLGVLFCLFSVPDDSWPARHLWEAYGGEHCQVISQRRILWVLYSATPGVHRPKIFQESLWIAADHYTGVSMDGLDMFD